MNDEEVEVLSTDQEQPEQVESKPTERRQSLDEKLDEIQQGMNDVGRTIETVGKGEEKVANWMDGSEKGTKTASDIGTATSSATEKGAAAAKSTAEAKEKAAHAAAETAKAAKETARAGKAAAKGGEAASKGTQAAGEGMSAAGNSPYTAGLKVAGETVKTGGKIGEGVSKAAEAGATAAEAGAASAEASAKALEAEAKAEKGAASAAEAAAKASKVGNQAVKKASDKSFSDKLRERGKLNQARGKRIQDLSNKFSSDEFFKNVEDKFGKAGKLLKGIAKMFDPKVIGVVSLLIIIIGTLLVSYILSPLFFMDLIRQSASDPDRVEKVNNYLSGLGFQDSKEAFYKEVDYLNIHYGKEIDYPYIMSALYYADIYYGDNEYISTEDNKKLCTSIDKTNNAEACNTLQIGVQLAKFYLKESSTTTDSNRLVYSANKIYRLRELAKHQFLGDKEIKTVSLKQYLADESSKMNAENKKMLEYLPWVSAYILAHADPATGTAFDAFVTNREIGSGLTDLVSLLQGTDSWSSLSIKIENGKYDAGSINALKSFITTYLGFYLNIEGVEFNIPNLSDADSILSSISIKYYEYSYDQDKFEDYLIDHYVREMPEFSMLIRDDEGKISDDKVEKVVYEIKLTKDIFDDIYKKDKTAQEYSSCIGDINVDLLNELVPPIDLTTGQKITFSGSNNFGYYKGVKHNGVDLEESSTGTKAGANVYSIYDGKVVESTADGTFTDKTVKGGGLLIEYTIQYEDSSIGDSKLSKNFKSQLSTIRVYYGGLNPSNLTLKKGSVVKKGDIIGHVGDATASENGLKPSLHFGVYDMKSRLFLNPINIFISCDNNKKSSSSNKTTTTTTTTNVTLSSSKVLEVHKVSITRDNFIKTINKYKKSGSCGAACKRLLNDPGLVYDYSVKYNVNPELVVTRAHYEGFVPNNKTKTNYNFWSIGCYNATKGKCAKYSTLEAGIKGFANSVKNYKNIDSMMQKYGYIGDYWYNPGNSGDGGCYFYKYIKKYMTDENRVNKIAIACKKENKCTVYGNHKNCLKTTAADQTAYKKYNVALMNSFFNKWFKKYH